jgi:hypothetical protein
VILLLPFITGITLSPFEGESLEERGRVWRGVVVVVTCVACGVDTGREFTEYISAMLGSTATSLESSGCWEQTHEYTHPARHRYIPDHNNKQKLILSIPFRK